MRWLIACGVLMAGCNESGVPACAQPAAKLDCGGDLVGTWKLGCYQSFGDATVKSYPQQTWIFDGSGKYSWSSDGASCDALNEAAGNHSGSCTTSGTQCACTHTLTSMSQMGSYTISGGEISIPSFTGPYCVAGNTLVLPIQVGDYTTAGSFERQ